MENGESRVKNQELRIENCGVGLTHNVKNTIPNSQFAIRNSSPRYEVKIPLPLHRLDDVLAWIRLHPAHWRVAYPSRQVNNIYFDTHTLTALHANLSGIGERAKLRLRWYGENIVQIDTAQLELKRKSGMAGWKQIAAVNVHLNLSANSWRESLAWLRSARSGPAQHWFSQYPVPVLINSYQRAYYVTPDGVVRLTVDTDLCAYPQRAMLYPNLTRPATLPANLVVELKTPIADAKRITSVLDRFPVRVDRFSKYVQGMLAV